MKNSKVGSVNMLLVIIIVLFVSALLYTTSKNKSINTDSSAAFTPETLSSPASVQSVPQTRNDFEVIQRILSSWTATQKTFVSKAGESGVYNPPSKIQFISPDTTLINYDDGLVDHISVLQFKDNAFKELKHIGMMNKMSSDQWKGLVSSYGSANFEVGNYESGDHKSFTKVSRNIFVR